jgi:hypothetical protein
MAPTILIGAYKIVGTPAGEKEANTKKRKAERPIYLESSERELEDYV